MRGDGVTALVNVVEAGASFETPTKA